LVVDWCGCLCHDGSSHYEEAYDECFEKFSQAVPDSLEIFEMRAPSLPVLEHLTAGLRLASLNHSYAKSSISTVVMTKKSEDITSF
jgi:hypothetical protein